MNKRRLLIQYAWISIVLFQSSALFCYRPFTTEDAGVAGKGIFQAEMDAGYLKWDREEKEFLFTWIPIYGISNSWEVSMEVPHFWHYSTGDGNHKGLGDINLVGKCLVAEKEDFPAFVLKGVLKTRTGDETLGLGTGDEDYQFAAAASKQIGKYALHGMFGYTLTGKERHPELRNTHFYGMAADYEMNEKWHLAAELSGQRHPDRESKTDPLATFLGFTCRISEKMTGDGGVKIGNTESAQKWSLHSGVTITF